MSRTNAGQGLPNAAYPQNPLVIVSDQGRNDQSSRRLVRAQAARASAAQSRATRARNRELFDLQRRASETGNARPSLSTHRCEASTATGLAIVEDGRGVSTPLMIWLRDQVGLAGPDTNVREYFVSSNARLPTTLLDLSRDPGRPVERTWHHETFSLDMRLPMATPKGFAELQRRVPISAALLELLGRTACVDFASRGVDDRLHALLVALVHFRDDSDAMFPASHPIQGFLRTACICITIFQGQRVDGTSFAADERYRGGLEAACAEATQFSVDALEDQNTAEAALWATFMISVTTGATPGPFQAILLELLSGLHLQQWTQVRSLLLEFIYPVSFVEDAARAFYHSLMR